MNHKEIEQEISWLEEEINQDQTVQDSGSHSGFHKARLEENERLLQEFKDMLINEFRLGERVIVKSQVELGECVVVNPYDPTEILRVGDGPDILGKPVGHYVRIDSIDPKGRKNMGYHAESLEKLGE